MTNYKYYVEQKLPERSQIRNVDLMLSVSPADGNLLVVGFMKAGIEPILFPSPWILGAQHNTWHAMGTQETFLELNERVTQRGQKNYAKNGYGHRSRECRHIPNPMKGKRVWNRDDFWEQLEDKKSWLAHWMPGRYPTERRCFFPQLWDVDLFGCSWIWGF